jgi:hypothetical protein
VRKTDPQFAIYAPTEKLQLQTQTPPMIAKVKNQGDREAVRTSQALIDLHDAILFFLGNRFLWPTNYAAGSLERSPPRRSQSSLMILSACACINLYTNQ